jgi:para-aminobenzoate synthetase component 1
LAAEPGVVVRAKGKAAGDAFARLAQLLRERQGQPGAAIGYFGYDLKNQTEKLPATAVDDLGLPDVWFGFYDEVHRIQALPARVRSGGSGREDLRCNFTRDDYCDAVRRAKEYIAAGDIYQVNLSQRFQAEIAASPAEAYLALRSANPAPYAAYLDIGDAQILSSSPECFLRMRDREVVTRPIKGTLPRHRDPQDLLRSTKDNAELLMITDLERNDLGKVCEFGSVHVPSLVSVESYATVHHLVATVAGRLRPEVSHVEAVRACFPGGSITGAPKIRAMEIIDELEPHARGVYCGAIGYFGFDGHSEFNIAIRTAVLMNARLTFHAGGGIVADSEPVAEYDETLAKAEGIIRALDQLRVRQRPLHSVQPSPRRD